MVQDREGLLAADCHKTKTTSSVSSSNIMFSSHFRSSMLISIVLSLTDSALSQSVTLPDPTQCVGPPITMSSCSAFFSIYDRCAAITSGQASAASCYCVQSVRDKLAGYGDLLVSVGHADLYIAVIKNGGIASPLQM